MIVSIISALLSAAAVVLTAWLTYRSNTKAKEIETRTLPPKDVRERLDEVEAKVGLLLQEQWVDRTYMRSMLTAWPSDRPLPQPMPPWLAQHYGLPPQHPPTPGSIIQPPRRK